MRIYRSVFEALQTESEFRKTQEFVGGASWCCMRFRAYKMVAALSHHDGEKWRGRVAGATRRRVHLCWSGFMGTEHDRFIVDSKY